ncbi:MAG: imidazole glycerol phosphate synthase subunit HisH [Solirubrobacterales bacterium]
MAILDYGMGNVRSVSKAIERVGASTELTSDPSRAADADGLVLPGVGAFPKAMANVRERGLDQLVAGRIAEGVPVLGICLGYQLLFDSSAELGGADGLGVLAGPVTALDPHGLKIPHIGWEPVDWTAESELTDGISDRMPFYFVHSFTPRPADEADVLGTAEHGERFACAAARPPVYGVQFHPEKSSSAGLRLLSNFVRICAQVPAV